MRCLNVLLTSGQPPSAEQRVPPRDAELEAIWAYVRMLGPAGTEMPAALPPGQTPDGPVVRFPQPPEPADRH